MKLLTRRRLLQAAGLAAPTLILPRADAQFGACLPAFCGPQGVCAISVSSDTWNPADKTGGMILSNSNKTVTSTSGGTGGVRTIGTHTTGKWVIQLDCTTMTGNIFDSDGLGICTAATVLTTIPGAATSFWVRSDGLMFVGPSSLGIGIDALNAALISFAINLDTQLLWCRNSFNGPDWIGPTFSPSDPATGLNGIDVSGIFGLSVAVYPCMTGDATTTDVTTFVQAPTGLPAGFCPW